jgi:hypothetical protein
VDAGVRGRWDFGAEDVRGTSRMSPAQRAAGLPRDPRASAAKSA